MTRLLSILITCVLLVGVTWLTAYGQKPDKPVKSGKKANAVSIEKSSDESKAKPRPRSQEVLSDDELAQRETLAFALVRKHHPELESLLRPLQRRKPRQYETAIRDLSRVSERLRQIERRQPERYEAELEIWKSKSRIQLMAAQLRMSPDDESLRDRLRTEIAALIGAQRRSFELEKSRMTQRLEWLDKQLDRLDGDVTPVVERRLRAIAPAEKKRSRKRNQTTNANPPSAE
ncbi:MAG: hypothetical protein ACIALR_14095 [Blastopirellula sp. JB062]